MLILDVVEHETIWGGCRLSQDPESTKKIGHLYSLITEDEMASRIKNGPHAGETFRDYFNEHKDELGMEKYPVFPFVVALVDAEDNLSIQVHPDDDTAMALEKRPHGKNESWFFLEVPSNGHIYNGCTCRNNAELRNRLDTKALDGVTDTLPVSSGDYVYVEAGTLHALSKGSLIYEIEENCNLTYRFFDFNRTDHNGLRRALHTEKAFQAIDIKKKSVAKNYVSTEPITERRYSTQLLRAISCFENTGAELACFTVIDGNFLLDGFEIIPGTSILLLPGERIFCDVKIAIVARPRLFETKHGGCYES